MKGISMTNQLATIKNQLTSDTTTKDIAIAMGADPKNEKSINKAAKYAYGVLSTIEASVGTKQDLSRCDPNSVKSTMIEAVNRGIYIDGRQHAHLVKYGNKCTFQMGWRGYIAKIKEYYPDADFVVEPVYSGDKVKIWNDNGVQKYTHEKAGAFRSGGKDFLGILFAVTFTDNGRLIQKVTDVPKERIDRAKKAAKQHYIWDSDYIEKAKAAAIKHACKQLFASIQGLQDLVDYDNRSNYDPNNQPATPARKSIVDNINDTVSLKEGDNEEQEVAHDDSEVIEGECVHIEESPPQTGLNQHESENLIIEGEKHAQKGWNPYKEWVANLSDEQKDVVRSKHKDWTEQARKVSTEAAAQETKPQEDSDAPPI